MDFRLLVRSGTLGRDQNHIRSGKCKRRTSGNGQRWAAQNLKGTISMVDPKMDLVVVRDSSGVPFDFKVARSTRIDAGAKREELSQLAPNQSVSVHFVPEAQRRHRSNHPSES